MGRVCPWPCITREVGCVVCVLCCAVLATIMTTDDISASTASLLLVNLLRQTFMKKYWITRTSDEENKNGNIPLY